MAIFIASTKSISRGNGQSAVASASYRAGVELEDKRYGKTHDYSKKHGVMSADIIFPTALAAANADIDRSDLWNKAEDAEKRKDARVAREWLVNLPHELNEQDRKELAHNFAQTLADRYGTIADCAIHQPTQKEIARGADPRNFHAHIMFTTRTAALDDNLEIILTDKASIELSDDKRRSLGMERVSHEIKAVRQIWEQLANETLVEHNHKLIDRRSYAEQGKNIEPQFKMGPVATRLERDKYEQELEKVEQANKKGEVYEIDETPATIRGEINALIAERNALVLQVSNRMIVEKRDLNERFERTERSIERADQRIGFSERWINSNSNRASRSEQDIEWARKQCENLPKRIDDTKQRIMLSEQRVAKVTKRIDLSEQWIAANSKRATGNEQLANRVSESIQKSDRQIDSRTARVSPSAPSPFDDNARRARASRRKRAIAELDKRAKLFDDISYETNYDIEYRKSAIDRINDKSDELIAETVQLFIYRKDNPDFSNRQQEVLQRWAAENELIIADFRDRYQSATLFFNNAGNIKNHQNIVRLLRDPQTEENNHSKTLKSDPQSDLNPLTRDNTSNLSQTSNTATDSISVSPRRYKP